MTAAGRVVAIGHSSADRVVVADAAEAGALLSTHLGNGLPQMLHKVDNPLFAQLAEDRLWASFIADGIHLPAAALKTMLRAKGRGANRSSSPMRSRRPRRSPASTRSPGCRWSTPPMAASGCPAAGISPDPP